jgi:hypothetical protein
VITKIILIVGCTLISVGSMMDGDWKKIVLSILYFIANLIIFIF